MLALCLSGKEHTLWWNFGLSWINISYSGRKRTAHPQRRLEMVGLDPQDGSRYPHELSRGQRQRIARARTLASNPKVLILDESVSALDVSVQAQILNVLSRLTTHRKPTMLFISHNLSVVAYMADDIAVIHNGRIVETGPTASVLETPHNPYTMELVQTCSITGLDETPLPRA